MVKFQPEFLNFLLHLQNTEHDTFILAFRLTILHSHAAINSHGVCLQHFGGSKSHPLGVCLQHFGGSKSPLPSIELDVGGRTPRFCLV